MPRTFSFIIGAKGVKPAFTGNAQKNLMLTKILKN